MPDVNHKNFIALAEIAPLSCSMCAPALPTRTCPSGTRISSVSARTSPSSLLETRSTSRTERSRPSRSLSTERRTCSTMISLPSPTISSKSLSSGCSADLSGKLIFTLLNNYSDPNLTLVEAPVLQPSEIAIDQDQIQNMNKELEDAANMDLPEGEGDDDF